MILLIGEDSSSSLSEFSPIINPLVGTGILKLENCYFQLGPLRSNEIVIFVRLPNCEFCKVTKLWLLWSYQIVTFVKLPNWDFCEVTKLSLSWNYQIGLLWSYPIGSFVKLPNLDFCEVTKLDCCEVAKLCSFMKLTNCHLNKVTKLSLLRHYQIIITKLTLLNYYYPIVISKNWSI